MMTIFVNFTQCRVTWEGSIGEEWPRLAQALGMSLRDFPSSAHWGENAGNTIHRLDPGLNGKDGVS